MLYWKNKTKMIIRCFNKNFYKYLHTNVSDISKAFSVGWGTDVRVKRVLVLNKSAAKLTGRLTPPRHPRRSAPSGAETSTLLSLTKRPANCPVRITLPDKTRRGRAGVAAEPLCASPRFRPLSRFLFWIPMVLIIEIIYGACTRWILLFSHAKATMYQPMNVFQISPEIVPYSVRSS